MQNEPQATRLVLAVGSTPEWEELWAEKVTDEELRDWIWQTHEAVLIHDENRYSTDEEFEAFLKAKCEEHSKPFLHSVEGLSINSTTWTPKACCN